VGRVDGRWTAEQVDQVRQLVRSELAKTTAIEAAAVEPVAAVDAVLKSATVVSRFKVEDMRSLASREAQLEQLRTESTPLRDGWPSVPAPVRNAVLATVSGRELRRLITVNEKPGDPVQRAIAAALDGLPEERLGELRPQELSALNLLHAGLSNVAPSLPSRDVISRELDLARLLAPFRVLTSNFRGRASELEMLRRYVGVVPPRSLLGAPVVSGERKAPVLIFGVGGVGKSTLIARFILEHALIGREQQFPFVYIDFDRPVVNVEQPLTIIPEAIRQIGLQYDVAHVASENLSERLQRSLPDLQPFAAEEQDEKFIQEFASFLDLLRVGEGPILLVLDTLEEAQVRSAAYARALIRFAERVSARLRRLRVVIVGRCDIPDVQFDQRVALTAFDRVSAVAYLTSRGITERDAVTIFTQLGGNPLTLRLAAEVVEKGTGVDVFTRVRGSVLHGQLFDRILLHVEDVDVRRLLYAGVVLRRITPELIRDVLSAPADIEVADLQRAEELFAALAKQITIVHDERPGVLSPRTDVRAMMLPLLRETDPVRVDEIHRAVVDFYALRDDVRSRAEEIYHRLALRQSRDDVSCRLTPGVEPYLTDAMNDFAPAEQALLADLLGVEVPTSAIEAADQETWERSTARAVREALQTGDLVRIPTLLKQRSARSAGTDLRLVEVRYLLSVRHEKQALELAKAGIEEYDRAGNAPALIAMLLLLAMLHIQRSHFPEAAELLGRAEVLAKDRDPILLLRVQRDRVALLHAREMMVPESMRKDLADTLGRVSDEQLSFDLMLVRDVAAELDHDVHVVRRAVQLGAIPLRESHLHEIRRLLTELNVAAPEPLSETLPDLLTDDAGGHRIMRVLRDSLRERSSASRSHSARRVGHASIGLDVLPRLRNLMATLLDSKSLGALLELQLNRSLESLTLETAPSAQIAEVVTAAYRDRWVEDLIVSLIRWNRNNDDVQRFAASLDMGVRIAPRRRTDQQTRTSERFLFHPGKLGEIEAATCTIEVGNEIRGCGLILPDGLVITAAPVVNVARKRDLRFRFGRFTQHGREIVPGNLNSMTSAGVVYHDKRAAFVLVRLKNSLPSEFIAITDRRSALRGGDLGWLWRSQQGTFFDGMTGFEPTVPCPDGTVSVAVPSLPHQIGCACVDGKLRVVGIHYGPDPKRANASLVMPLGTIVAALMKTRFTYILYEDYAM
jgi:hypothetical protein